MAFNTYLYLFFFLGGTFAAYTFIPKKFKWFVLLLASYWFYYLSCGWLIVSLLATTLSVYYAGIWLSKIEETFEASKKTLLKEERKLYKTKIQRQKKTVVVFLLILNFGLLFFLKYFNFFTSSVNMLISFLHIPITFGVHKLAIPLGISFYTLQAVSYVIDVYRGKFPADKNLGRVALFLCFFPQIVEGPIGRYDQLAHQLYEGHKVDYKNVTFGMQLIIWGLFKKMVIADRANAFVNKVFTGYEQYSGITIIAAMLLYTLQIYAEFSGCMDIVTGSAQMFGIHLAKNFERPFFSNTINDFWRRWHITLGAWLRDYVFYSVSLSKIFMKVSKHVKNHLNEHFGRLVPAAIALFFVWFGNGIWHGAGYKYIAYGMYYYAIMLMGMLFEPLFQKILSALHIRREWKPYRLIQIFRTFILVNFGMLLFRSAGVKEAFKMFLSIFTGFSTSVLKNNLLLKLGIDQLDVYVLLIGVVIMFIVGLLQERGHSLRQEIANRNIVIRWTIYLTGLFAVVLLGAYGTGYSTVDFIYANF